MDYKKYIGEEVIRVDGVSGKLIDVNNSGFVKFDFEDKFYDGFFMVDPFLEEKVRFKNDSIQKLIDDIIFEREKEVQSIIKNKTVSDKKDANFIISRHDYKTDEQTIIYMLCCSFEEFQVVFSHEIDQYQKFMHKYPGKYVPCVFKGFDVLTEQQIAQETFHPL